MARNRGPSRSPAARVQFEGSLKRHRLRPRFVGGKQFVASIHSIFAPPNWQRPSLDDLTQISWSLAGLTTLADWIGSRQAWFPYVTPADVADPASYYREQAIPRAKIALAEAGLTASKPAQFQGIKPLFPGVQTPTPIQAWAESVLLPEGASLAIIEDLTGSGKTEAAMVLAHRLLAAGRADGIYFALPTMATANAMFDRLADGYRKLFTAETNPSLALAHGRASLDPRFAASIDAIATDARACAGEPANEPAESHCASWLAEDRRRALLAQVGVGTLDQALLAVLPVRHSVLRLYGIARKILIADEIHAFDSYMQEELATLLQFHAALGGSAILLSATLPQKIRAKLVDAFRFGLNSQQTKIRLTGTAYPLATMVGAAGHEETPCAPREGLPRKITVTRLPDVDAAVARLVDAAKLGAASVWIRNTVDDAIAAVGYLRAQGLSPLLFHARFAMADRLKIEAEVLRVFGRTSSGDSRNRILVATQVVEQSLDIDFDVMVTDLAPADLLIQRAGRLWRHKRGPRCVPDPPELLVISPPPEGAPAPDWISKSLGGTSAVYRDHALLWRSARELFRRGAMETPADMRPIIEAVADQDAEGAIPAALEKSASQAYAKQLVQAGIAAQNVLTFQNGYYRNDWLWEPDTKTPTRLEERPHVALRLAVLRDGRLMPYAQDADLRHAWALSEVHVAQYRIAACPIPPGLEAAAVLAKEAWGRWERESPMVCLAVLIPDGDGFRLEARSKKAAVSVRYDDKLGISWP